MNFNQKKLTLFFVILFFPITFIFPRLTKEEQQEIIENCQPPQDIKNKLDNFFSDKLVKMFYIEREKIPLIAAPHRLSMLEKIALGAKYAQCFLDYYLLYRPILQNIITKYNLQIFPKALPSSGFLNDLKNKIRYEMKQYRVFYFEDLPGYVIKINTRKWPLKYQNVSRVFYNEKIRQAASELNLRHVKIFKKFLYHIPGQPEELNDENYIVIADRISNLPDVNTNKIYFQELVDDFMYANPEYEDLLVEIIQLITYCGLWDVKAHNSFILIAFNESKSIVFIDTEQPGLGGSDDENFFHKNLLQVAANANCGFNCLRALLKGK